MTKPKKGELFAKVGLYKDSDRVNKEGHKSFSLPLKEQFVMTVLTNTVENTFYATKTELAEESLNIHSKMLNEDKEFYAKAVIYGRNKGCMRLQPILGTVYLSTLQNKGYFNTAFKEVIKTPKDLISFIDLSRSGAVRAGLGRVTKEAIINYLKANLTEYYAIKYKPDVLVACKLSRINKKKLEPTVKQMVEYLFDEKVGKDLKQIKAIENLKDEEDEVKILKLIDEGKLPHEAVTGSVKKMTHKIWKHLMRQMPYFALLRHLNTLAKNDVFKDKEAVDYVAGRLSDLESLKKSRVLPFRIFTAYKFAQGLPTKVTDALRKALDNSFVNLPDIPGKVCIAPDVSGSMSGGMVGKSQMSYIDLAGIFSAALLKKCGDDAIVLPVDTSLHEHTCTKMDSLMTNAKKLTQLGGGGTELDLPLAYLRKEKIKVDVYIGITDSEEWYESTRYWGKSRGVLQELRAYKREVNPDLKTFLITLAPYGDSVTPKNEPNVWHVFGWNDNVLAYITTTLEGRTQMDEIEKTQLKPQPAKKSKKRKK